MWPFAEEPAKRERRKGKGRRSDEQQKRLLTPMLLQ
jgi:hypothetical protein